MIKPLLDALERVHAEWAYCIATLLPITSWCGKMALPCCWISVRRGAISSQEAARRYENAFKSPPVEITEARFMEMLGVLPPLGRRHACDAESFKLMELTAGSVTTSFVRIGARYFEMSDSVYLKHDDCIARCRAIM